jgi:hypothetical protein
MNSTNKKRFTELYLKYTLEKKPSFATRINCIPPIDLTENGSVTLTKLIHIFLDMSGHESQDQRTTGRKKDTRKTVKDCIGRQRSIGSVTYMKSLDKVGRADIDATMMIPINGQIIPVAVEIEIKWNKDKQSDDQIKYQKNLESKGGKYFIIKTFDDFVTWYDWFINSFS